MNATPFLVRLVAATILARQNKALIAEIAYLKAEVEFLRSCIPADQPLRFTDRWRKRLARTAAGVGWKRLAEIASVAKASTIRGWHRLMVKGKLGIAKAGPGRKPTDPEIEKTVIRMACDNPTWGQKRIRGELLKVGVEVAARTVAAILDRHGIKPAPQRGSDWSWKRFMTEKADELVATDFFSVEVPTLLGKRVFDVLFAIHVATRKVTIVGLTEHATKEFMVQTARNLTMDGGWLHEVGAKRIIHAFAERWVRTVKRELIRRAWFLSEGALRRYLTEYVEHYNAERPHQGKGNRPLSQANAQPQAPAQQSVTGFKAGQVRRIARCGGVISHYERAAA